MGRFDELLGELQSKLLEMSGLVQSAIRQSVQALEAGDQSSAQFVFKQESDINRLELEIDEIATTILALDHPVASDLRFVTAAGKINSNLERIGDLAANIADRSQSLVQHPHFASRTDIPKLAELAEAMVQRALDAYVKKDADGARAVLLSDAAVDVLRDSALLDLIGEMKKSPESVEACVDLLLVARNLERIADHATNIAEAAIFMIEGAEVRHHRIRIGQKAPAAL